MSNVTNYKIYPYLGNMLTADTRYLQPILLDAQLFPLPQCVPHREHRVTETNYGNKS